MVLRCIVFSVETNTGGALLINVNVCVPPYVCTKYLYILNGHTVPYVHTYIIRNYTNANGIIKRVPRIAYEADGTPSMFESRWAVTHLSQLTVIRKCLENFTRSRCHSIPQRERSHQFEKLVYTYVRVYGYMYVYIIYRFTFFS